MRILMVCLGNICRSPIAEGVMRYKIEQHGLDWTVDSAGTESYHVGEAPHRFSQKICMEHGIDISMLRARRFKAGDFERFDMIYAMAADVFEEILDIANGHADRAKLDIFLNELEPGANQSVPDPYYGTEEGYTFVYELIDRTCDEIIKKYSK